jgi:hypothetical protein
VKKSLLEIVQDILNDIDGDNVNSISETEEALQAAYIVKSTFEELMTLKDAPHLRRLTTLDNVSDITKPNYLKLPENLSRLDFVKYNKKTDDEDADRYGDVRYMHPDDFTSYCNNRNPEHDNIDVITDFDGTKLNIITDQAPKFYTSFDDRHVVFDGWVKDISTTLVEGESQALMYLIPEMRLEDDYVAPIPIEWFPYLIAEAKSAATYKLRQVPDHKEEQKSKRQRRAMAQRGWRTNGGVRYHNYGRPSKGRVIRSHLPKYYE